MINSVFIAKFPYFSPHEVGFVRNGYVGFKRYFHKPDPNSSIFKYKFLVIEQNDSLSSDFIREREKKKRVTGHVFVTINYSRDLLGFPFQNESMLNRLDSFAVMTD